MKLSKINPLLYWGDGPVPTGAEIIGTIRRDAGDAGALIRLWNGNYVQGNAGIFRMLDQGLVGKLLVAKA